MESGRNVDEKPRPRPSCLHIWSLNGEILEPAANTLLLRKPSVESKESWLQAAADRRRVPSQQPGRGSARFFREVRKKPPKPVPVGKPVQNANTHLAATHNIEEARQRGLRRSRPEHSAAIFDFTGVPLCKPHHLRAANGIKTIYSVPGLNFHDPLAPLLAFFWRLRHYTSCQFATKSAIPSRQSTTARDAGFANPGRRQQ
jgi:hypothetical protein